MKSGAVKRGRELAGTKQTELVIEGSRRGARQVHPRGEDRRGRIVRWPARASRMTSNGAGFSRIASNAARLRGIEMKVMAVTVALVLGAAPSATANAQPVVGGGVTASRTPVVLVDSTGKFAARPLTDNIMLVAANGGDVEAPALIRPIYDDMGREASGAVIYSILYGNGCAPVTVQQGGLVAVEATVNLTLAFPPPLSFQ